MQTSIRKIGTILLLIILLPLTIYTIYELSSLSENERVIEDIYSEQLNTIIFSVNQFVDDNLQGWVAKINNLRQEPVLEKKEMIEFLESNPSISLIVIADTSISDDIQLFSSKWDSDSPRAIERMQNLLKDNSQIIQELIKYKNQGYNKIQSLVNKFDDTPLLSFLINDVNNDIQIATIIINMENFIDDIILKKINSISNNDLVISIFHNEELVSYTGTNEVAFDELLEYKELWTFPNYYLGISTPGKTIKDISKERTLTNLIILGFLNLFILLGVWFLFINIRKEIKLSQLKSDFVSNVSHEIRTPLSLIGMFAETLELNRVDTEEQKNEYYRIIRKETERLTRIVNSILNFSKMESNNEKFSFKELDLNDVLDEVLKTYQHELNNNKHECIINKSNDLPTLVLDRESIIEAIMNLIDNALKYSEGKCKIEINTGIEDKFVYLEVTDNGIGISKENQKKIFEKFYRVSSGNVHNSKGSGLGLSLVTNIMEAHNGSVTVKSKLGKGSKFTLLFPIS
ncbi:MAG: HAMP domain-containing histidine kinase [Melioribacteraceae bacterium]|nr:HAMP domain-containing histidine kinase [Melioribacteraceae bacterium]